MRITFVYSGSESYAIEILSSVLKEAGHQVFLVFDPSLFDDKQYFNIPILNHLLSYKKKILVEIKKTNPDLIAFSLVTDNYQWGCEISREIKKEINVPIIFGGIHPTSVPEKVIKNNFIDMICIGEGEEAIVQLANSLAKGKIDHTIKNIWFKKNNKLIKNIIRPLIQDLDKLPLPDKDLFAKHIILINGRYMVMTSRGCPYNCTYCYNNSLRKNYNFDKNYVRQRSVDNVLKELKIMKEKYNYKNVEFMDDLFAANRVWIKSFLPKYKQEINVPFECMIHPFLIDEELVKLLKQNYCVRIKFGIQTAIEKTRFNILKRFEKNIQIENALNLCDKYKIPYSVDHIFGIPTEGEQEQKQSAEFYAKINPKRINCYALSYFPKTDIVQIAKKEGILTDRDIETIEDGKGKMYNFGSSLKGYDLNLFKCYKKFYALYPILPKAVIRFSLKTNFFKIFRFIPNIFIYFLETIISLKNKHLRGINYLQYYIYHIKKRII